MSDEKVNPEQPQKPASQPSLTQPVVPAGTPLAQPTAPAASAPSQPAGATPAAPAAPAPAQPAVAAPQPAARAAHATAADAAHALAGNVKKRPGLLHVGLVLVGVNMFLIALVVTLISRDVRENELAQPVIILPPDSSAAKPPSPAQGAEQAAETASSRSTAPAAAPTPTASPSTSASWAAAETAFERNDCARAILHYQQLLTLAQAKPADELVCDFLKLRMAICLERLDRPKLANDQFVQLAQCSTPVVAAVANYRLAAADMAVRQYFRARTRGYAALANLTALSRPLPLMLDCDYLVAQALSGKAAGFHDMAPPPWPPTAERDPFAGLDQQALRTLLADGVGWVSKASLGPVIRKVETAAPAQRWQAACASASLEDLLARLAAQTGTGIEWSGVSPAARARAVTLACTMVSEQRLVEIACGMAGLVARFTGGKIIILDPQGAGEIAQQRAVLHEEALSVWRRFFVRAPDEQRVPYGRFAVALLHEGAGENLEAIQEYQHLAGRYAREQLAPAALLRCAQLRLKMKDWAGARADLLNLLDSHPNFPAADQVYLALGQAALETGRLQEAASAFQKLYYLELSSASQRGACFGAASCLFRQGDHVAAARWLQRYVQSARPGEDERLAEAWFMLAQCEGKLWQPAKAMQSMQRCLDAQPQGPQRVETLLELARMRAEAGQFGLALGVLSQVEREQLTDEQTARYCITAARAYRQAMLPEKALAVLRAKASAVRDESLQATLAVELAQCQAAAGDLPAATETLREALPRIKPGAASQEVACILAEMCLKTGKSSQSVTLAEQVLKAPANAALRKRASEVLGAAYAEQKEYHKAAVALSGARSMGEGGGKE